MLLTEALALSCIFYHLQYLVLLNLINWMLHIALALQSQKFSCFLHYFGLGGRIRTFSPLRPRQVAYQISLHPDFNHAARI